MHSFIFFISMIFLTACGTTEVYKEGETVPKPYPAPALEYDCKEAYLNTLNQVRRQGRSCGNEGYFSSAPELRWSEPLYRSSYEHSHDMAKSSSFSHVGSFKSYDWTAKVQHLKRGSSFKERIENNGYTRWKNIAENIAMGSSTIEGVMGQWLRSNRHCANIMNPEFTDVGMARLKREGAEQSYYWTQNFAAAQ